MSGKNNMAHQLPDRPTEKQDVGTFSRGLLNILLVFLESAITLALRFDPKLRELAYPLASRDKVVCIRTYLPHTQIFATFGYRGVLLDDRLPTGRTADITINAYTHQLITILTNHNPASVDNLQIRGDSTDVIDLKVFLVRLGVGGAIQNLLAKFQGKPKPTPEEREQKQENYKAKIAEQSATIDALTNDNRRLSVALAETQGKQKSTFKGFMVACVVAFCAIVSHFIW